MFFLVYQPVWMHHLQAFMDHIKVYISVSEQANVEKFTDFMSYKLCCDACGCFCWLWFTLTIMREDAEFGKMEMETPIREMLITKIKSTHLFVHCNTNLHLFKYQHFFNQLNFIVLMWLWWLLDASEFALRHSKCFWLLLLPSCSCFIF